MSDNSFKTQIKTILEKSTIEGKDFDCIEVFKEISKNFTSGNLASEDKDEYAQLFHALGVKLLNSSHNTETRKPYLLKVQDFFSVARDLSQKAGEMSLAQGKSYLEFAQTPEDLVKACESFFHAETCGIDSFDLYFHWIGASLNRLNTMDNEILTSLQILFEKGSNRLSEATPELSVRFYETWGNYFSLQGSIFEEAKEYVLATQKFTQAIEISSTLFSSWYTYGEALEALGMLLGQQSYLIEACECFFKAIASDPTLVKAHYHLAYLQHLFFETEGSPIFFQTAEQSYEKVIALVDDHFDAWYKLGQLYITLAKNEKNLHILCKSLEKFAKALEINPTEPLLLIQIAEVEMIIGLHTSDLTSLVSAEKHVKMGLNLSNNVDGWHVYGSCLLALGNYFEDTSYYYDAIDQFQKGLQCEQNHPLLWYGLGQSHFAIGESKQDIDMVEKSVAFYSRVLEFGGATFPQFWNDWAVALFKMAEWTSDPVYLLESLEKFEKLLSDNEEAYDVEWVYNYGCALDLQGDMTDDPEHYEKALEMFENVLEKTPNHPNARFNFALSLSHLGECMESEAIFEKSFEEFEKIVSVDPEDDVSWNSWGLALIHYAKLVEDEEQPEKTSWAYEQAEQKFLAALALGNIYVNYNLACLYSLMGEYKLSFHYIERADQASALPGIDDVMHDDWLEGLRSTSGFHRFLSQLSNRKSKK